MKKPSINILKSDMEIATIKVLKKPLILKLSPRKKLVRYNIIIFVSGYNIPKLKIVSGNVKNFKIGLIVLFKM